MTNDKLKARYMFMEDKWIEEKAKQEDGADVTAGKDLLPLSHYEDSVIRMLRNLPTETVLPRPREVLVEAVVDAAETALAMSKPGSWAALRAALDELGKGQ